MNSLAKKRAFQFVLITFLITYSSWLLFFYAHYNLGVNVFDDSPLGVLMLIGLFAPSLVGVVFRFKEGSHLNKIPILKSIPYLLLSVILPILFVFLDLGFAQSIDKRTTQNVFELVQNINTPAESIFLAFGMSIIFGGLEEIGWRGYLLPQMLKFLSPNKANLSVAILWTFWHVPLFFLPGVAQYQQNFFIFMMSMITLSSIMTFVWIKTQSTILAILTHTTFNTLAVLGFTGSNSFIQLIVSTILAIFAVVSLRNLLRIQKNVSY